MKKKLIFITIASLVFTNQVMATESTTTTNSRLNSAVEVRERLRNEVLPTKKAERQEVRTALKKTNSFKEIERRMASLTGLIEKVKSMKRLTDSQKNSLSSQIESEISNLNALKEKISIETDITKLNELKKQIVNSHRIYAFFMPKVTILAHANSIANLTELMISKTQKTELLTSLNDIKASVDALISTLVSLNSADYPNNKSTLEEAKSKLQAIRLRLANIRPLMK